jgi:predicted nucleic acid-binding protein
VRFWDSSALFPLIVHETTSEAMQALIRLDNQLLVSFLTPLELDAAVRRRTRLLKAAVRQEAAQARAALEITFLVIDDAYATLTRARHVIQTHALRTADSLQLAAALIARDRGMSFDFVSLDHDLSAAARAEGFPVLS